MSSRRDGFTLVEMTIAIMIYGIVLAAGIGFVAMQNTMFHRGLDRMTALQNLRYAISALETDIPTLGTNVPMNQPALVYAGPDVLAFSADYASNVTNDIFAAYVDEGAPNGQVTAPDPGVVIPNSGGYSWPATTYVSRAGTRSPAELLVFWFEPDSATSRADDFVLLRRVNRGAPEPLARNLLRDGSTPFFQYVRRTTVGGSPSIATVPAGSLPVAHTSTFHRVSTDTASSAVADSIRAVRVTFRSTNGFTGAGERIVTASRLIDMPNAGFTLLDTCGDDPIQGGSLQAELVDLGGGELVTRLAWPPAVDETGGERDVARYVLYRQTVPTGPDWGDPYLSVPAGLSSYSYDDGLLAPGQTYQYALAAQDCTPSLSDLVTSGLVAVP